MLAWTASVEQNENINENIDTNDLRVVPAPQSQSPLPKHACMTILGACSYYASRRRPLLACPAHGTHRQAGGPALALAQARPSAHKFGQWPRLSCVSLLSLPCGACRRLRGDPPRRSCCCTSLPAAAAASARSATAGPLTASRASTSTRHTGRMSLYVAAAAARPAAWLGLHDRPLCGTS